jgi:putative oxidoreductase
MHTRRTHSPADWGTALLRVSLGTMFLAHSVVLKLLTYGLPGTAAFFHNVGLPGWLAYVTFACEAVGGVLLVLGVQARWVALALSPFLLGALFSVHLPNGWVFTSAGGGWEYPAYLFVLCIAQALLGDGALASSPSRPLGSLLGRLAAQPVTH